MAFILDYPIVITYNSGDAQNYYSGILSQEDLIELGTAPTKKFVANNAYHRVDKLSVTKERIDFKLGIYTSDLSRLITTKDYNFIPDVSENSINYHTQAYEYAKTLPEFTEAVDC